MAAASAVGGLGVGGAQRGRRGGAVRCSWAMTKRPEARRGRARSAADRAGEGVGPLADAGRPGTGPPPPISRQRSGWARTPRSRRAKRAHRRRPAASAPGWARTPRWHRAEQAHPRARPARAPPRLPRRPTTPAPPGDFAVIADEPRTAARPAAARDADPPAARPHAPLDPKRSGRRERSDLPPPPWPRWCPYRPVSRLAAQAETVMPSDATLPCSILQHTRSGHGSPKPVLK
ncbi:MAG: hypothetical protein JWP53_807 [Conexibacter sp.]|nr:hypothetical protein [Conexibacter sp.]